MAEEFKQIVPLIEGVTATTAGTVLTVTGAKGVVVRSFLQPRVKISVTEEGVVFTSERFTRTEKKIINTFMAHVRNMLKGALEGHKYKLKICSGHFPMNVSLKGNKIEVKNFIGEVVPRVYTFKDGVKVKLDGEIITITGTDKELVSQAAGSIEQLTRRNGFDRRIFQDGIYIIDKDGKVL